MVTGRMRVLFILIKRPPSGPCHGKPLHRVVHYIPEGFLHSGQTEGQGQHTGPELLLSFCNLISEVTSGLFCRILFVRGELTSLAHFQGEGTT